MAAFSLPALSSLSLQNIINWRTLALLFAILNLKVLPLSWHIRLVYRAVLNWHSQRSQVRQLIRQHDGPTHPIFAPVSVWSRTPILELDYNYHKSNSTFFSDLDTSRTALFIRTFSSAYRPGFRELQGQGYHGQLKPILGSVHTSFKKEISVYQRYEIRSRILGWNEKWLLIISWFLVPGKSGKRGDEQLCASALSKYVIKKGRKTVDPEYALQVAGWLPAKPREEQEGVSDSCVDVASSSSTRQQPTARRGILKTTSNEPSPIQPAPVRSNSSTRSANGLLGAPIPSENTSSTNSNRNTSETSTTSSSNRRHHQRDEDDNGIKGRDWNWQTIDEERRRGLDIAQAWLDLDGSLAEEFGGSGG